MKRYAIVRVDDDYKHICPSAFEKVDDSSFCKLAIRKGGSCNVCPYGDTKEQLIVKVQQALFKSIFTEQLQKVVAIEEQKRIYKQYRPMAEKVVEFLGVK